MSLIYKHCIKLIVSFLGVVIGLTVGKLLLILSQTEIIEKHVLEILSLIFVGGFFVWYLLPIENSLVWNREINKINVSIEKIDKQYKFAPGTFFLILGMMLEIRFELF